MNSLIGQEKKLNQIKIQPESNQNLTSLNHSDWKNPTRIQPESNQNESLKLDKSNQNELLRLDKSNQNESFRLD